MTDLLLLAYSHGGSMVGHFTNMVVSAIVHGVMYAFLFRLMRHLSLGEGLVLVVVVIGALYLFSQARDRRRGRW